MKYILYRIDTFVLENFHYTMELVEISYTHFWRTHTKSPLHRVDTMVPDYFWKWGGLNFGRNYIFFGRQYTPKSTIGEGSSSISFIGVSRCVFWESISINWDWLRPPQETRFFELNPKSSFYHRKIPRSLLFLNIYSFLKSG